MDHTTSTTTEKTCAHCATSGFNYCRFSKTLVALPALCLVAFVPVALFDSPALKIAGAIGAVAIAIYAAIWIDRIPALQKKIKLFSSK